MDIHDESPQEVSAQGGIFMSISQNEQMPEVTLFFLFRQPLKDVICNHTRNDGKKKGLYYIHGTYTSPLSPV